MNDLLVETSESTFFITFNRLDKNNAFDDHLLKALLEHIRQANQDPSIRTIVLQANGQHFSAGADLEWMKRMAQFSEQENKQDALVLAEVMNALYTSTKPTLAIVQGGAYGGGAGIACACDIAIARDDAVFCFSEVKLGLIPAVISPYVVNAIGARQANWLFSTAEVIDAERAFQLGLVQYVKAHNELDTFLKKLTQRVARLAPQAVNDSKKLVQSIHALPITDSLIEKTAELIAKKRVSKEGQLGIQAFLNKQTPVWE